MIYIESPPPSAWRCVAAGYPVRSYVEAWDGHPEEIAGRVEDQRLLPLLVRYPGHRDEIVAAAAVERVEDDGPPPSFRMHIAYLSGVNVLKRISDFEASACRLAQALDCSVVSLRGRRGWRRVFRPLGWELMKDGETMRKELHGWI